MSLTDDRVASGIIRPSALLKTFDAVLILHLYRIPPQLAATILGHGPTLVGCLGAGENSGVVEG